MGLFKEREKYNLRIDENLIKTLKFYTRWQHDTMKSTDIPQLQMKLYKTITANSESVIGFIPRLIKEHNLNLLFKGLDKAQRKKKYRLFEMGMNSGMLNAPPQQMDDIWKKIFSEPGFYPNLNCTESI